MPVERYCFALDLVDDPDLIREYEEHHKNLWPEVEKSIREAGILAMDIYRVENRLFMIMGVGDDFSFEKKEQLDENNPVVQKWETLMWKYQQPLPGSDPNEKWRLMNQIYDLNSDL
jgi:L-rhamnose mutarotase